MKIKIIDFGLTPIHTPNRAHSNDAGLDIYSGEDYELLPGECHKFPLGFGLEIPAGYMGMIYPRSSLASQGIDCKQPPIDPGYRGEISAILYNGGNGPRQIWDGDRIGQLVILPCAIADLVYETTDHLRGQGAFGSTGR